MICLRSQLSLKKDTTAAEVWDAISKWRINSKNTPKKLRAWLSENPYEKLPGIPIDEKIGKVSISVYAVSKKSFAFKLLEDNDEFITTICFDSELSKYNFSLEMEIKEQYANKFSRPKIFNFISHLLPPDKYSKAAHKEGDYNTIANLITNNKSDMPVIYISADKNNKYLVDADALAIELFGIAHVYKEANYSFAKQLKIHTDGKNPYNGTIGIFYKKNRIYISPDRIQSFNFFHRISQLTLLIQFDDRLTWYGITRPFLQNTIENIKEKVEEVTKQITAITSRTIIDTMIKQAELTESKEYQKKLEFELQKLKTNIESKDKLISELGLQLKAEQEAKNSIEHELKEKKKENDEYITTFDEELEEKQNEIDSLKSENEKLKAYKDSFKNRNDSDISISIKCSEKPLYPSEIEDFIKAIIYTNAKKYDNYNGHSEKDPKGFIRLYHVLKAIKEENPNFNFEDTISYQQLKKISDASPDSDKQTIKILEDCGFEKDQDSKEHVKLYFYGDKRYCITLSSTGSDKRRTKNDLSRAKHFLLLPKDCE